MRYYLDTAQAGPKDGRIIYDNTDGMPVVVIMPQGNRWTDERQRLLEHVLALMNAEGS